MEDNNKLFYTNLCVQTADKMACFKFYEDNALLKSELIFGNVKTIQTIKICYKVFLTKNTFLAKYSRVNLKAIQYFT